MLQKDWPAIIYIQHIDIFYLWFEAVISKQICVQVLQWMEDAGVKPSYKMCHDIYSFAERSAGAENAAVIKERIRMLGLSNFQND